MKEKLLVPPFTATYNVSGYTYTKAVKYKIRGSDVVVNSKFNQCTIGFDFWKATEATLLLVGNLWNEKGPPKWMFLPKGISLVVNVIHCITANKIPFFYY